MRVSAKLTLGISGVTLLIAGVHGWRQMVQERRDLRGAVDREIRTLGNACQVSFEHALRDQQFTDIQGALDSLEGIAPDLDLFVFAPGGALRAQSAGSQEEDVLHRFASQASTQRAPILEIDTDIRWRATLGLPLIDDNGHDIGAIVAVKPLAEVRRDLHDTRRAILISLVALVVAVTGAQALLGTIWVTRPLTRMAAEMQKLRAGEPAARVGTRRNDEVGRLAEEFDALAGDLRVAHERIAREVETRIAIEQGLQRVDKLATIGQLSAGLAHEIGSPLQILSGRARALLTHDLRPEEVRKNASILAEQADRIARIVERLLDISRRRPSAFAPIDLAVPVRAIFDLVEPSARRRGIALTVVTDGRIPPVVADIDQIQQVVLNVLKNALAATPEGGRITLRLSSSAIDSANGRVAAVRLAVGDDGCGMSEEIRARLFEPFFTTRAAQGGTGLGLPVVRAIVQAHGGGMSVASTEGAGTRVTIDLPVAGARA